MTASTGRWRLAGLILAVLLTCGCNLVSLPYFLIFQDDKHPPDCLEFKDPKKEIKIVILPYLDPEARPEFIRADRDLAYLLCRKLRLMYQENKDKITIVPPSQVENFKDKHPSWKEMSIKDIGHHFHADYVINLDLDQMNLLEPNSPLLFRGRAQVFVKVFEVEKAEDGPVYPKTINFLYPKRGPKEMDSSTSVAQFRAEFLNHMVNELAHCFASYPMDDRYKVE
jgi:hypothetical protein